MAREDGRVVMVTGATSGIGEFTAELLAKDEGGDPYKAATPTSDRLYYIYIYIN